MISSIDSTETGESTMRLTPEQLTTGLKVIIVSSGTIPMLIGQPMEIIALQLPFVVGRVLNQSGRIILDSRATDLMELSPEMVAALEGRGEP